MDTVKDLLALFFGGRLLARGKDRTFAKAPVWLAALAAITSPQLLIVTALACVAFGVSVRVERA